MNFATGGFSLDREIAAGLPTVWRVLTDPKLREVWAAPDDDHVLHVDKHDVREGGRDRHRCGPKDAPDYTVETHWYRLVEPAFACFTETLDIGPERLSTSLVTYAVQPADTGTRLIVEVSIVSYAGDEAIPEHEAGWTSALDRLVALVAGGQFAGDRAG
ncbi:MAG: SRPBCC domain-containing protein [Pseudomonadota bacterium]